MSTSQWPGSRFKKRIYSLRSDFPLSIGAESFLENQIEKDPLGTPTQYRFEPYRQKKL
jgi:hypothetical protein